MVHSSSLLEDHSVCPESHKWFFLNGLTRSAQHSRHLLYRDHAWALMNGILSKPCLLFTRTNLYRIIFDSIYRVSDQPCTQVRGIHRLGFGKVLVVRWGTHYLFQQVQVRAYLGQVLILKRKFPA